MKYTFKCEMVPEVMAKFKWITMHHRINQRGLLNGKNHHVSKNQVGEDNTFMRSAEVLRQQMIKEYQASHAECMNPPDYIIIRRAQF